MSPTADEPLGGATGRSRRYQRLACLPFGALLGVVLAFGYARQGEPSMAVGALVTFPLVGAYLAFSRSELASASRDEGDERQRLIHREAATYAYYSLTWVAVIGFIRDVYTHRSGEPPGIFTLMLVVGVVSYTVAAFFLRRRR